MERAMKKGLPSSKTRQEVLEEAEIQWKEQEARYHEERKKAERMQPHCVSTYSDSPNSVISLVSESQDGQIHPVKRVLIYTAYPPEGGVWNTVLSPENRDLGIQTVET